MMIKKMALNTLCLAILALVTTHCGGSNGPKSGEELSALLTSHGSFGLQLTDFNDMVQQSNALCATNQLDSSESLPKFYDQTSASMTFQGNTFQITITQGVPPLTAIASGTWQVVDSNTIDMSFQVSSDGQLTNETRRVDVEPNGDALHLGVNMENRELNCSPMVSTSTSVVPTGIPGFGPDASNSLFFFPLTAVSPEIPETPITLPDQNGSVNALAGTWCYYAGIPYYLGFVVSDLTTSLNAAYFYQNTVKDTTKPLTLTTVNASFDETGKIAQIGLMSDAQSTALKMGATAPLTLNGKTGNYLKMNYGPLQVGFFKRSTSNTPGVCPDLAISDLSLSLMPK